MYHFFYMLQLFQYYQTYCTYGYSIVCYSAPWSFTDRGRILQYRPTRGDTVYEYLPTMASQHMGDNFYTRLPRLLQHYCPSCEKYKHKSLQYVQNSYHKTNHYRECLVIRLYFQVRIFKVIPFQS